MWDRDLAHFEYLPMNKNSATSIDSIPDESDSPSQVLANILPRHIHDIDDFVRDFLTSQKCEQKEQNSHVKKLFSW